METCNHRVFSKKTSITILKEFKTMVYPQTVYGVCEVCGQNFAFTVDKKGKLKLSKGENE